MALFVVTHQHKPETCPAGDRRLGPMLLQQLSKGNAAKSGITIRAEAVVDGQHTLQLILDGPSLEGVREFMAPFAQMGTVEVLPASPCEVVVQRARC
jgi:hypothetical protein